MDVTQAKIDDTDWRILAELQLDGRLSYKELGRRIHLSAPAVAERVRRLEDAGVIVGYGAHVDASHAGLPLLAFLQLRCRPDDCLLRTSTADDYTLTVTSDTSNTFSIERDDQGATTYECTASGEGGCPTTGSWAGDAPPAP